MSTSTLITHSPTAALQTRDLADPAQGRHGMQLLVTAVSNASSARWDVPAEIGYDHPVTTVTDNYDNLGYAPDAITRDQRYTRYLDSTRLLRTHTSAGIPPRLRRLAMQPEPPSRTLLVLPGICYRRDSIDRWHSATPHQLDLWLVRNDARTTMDDLHDLVHTVLPAVLPGRHWRWSRTQHPYTTDGRQVDAIVDGHATEVAECGRIVPDVLRAAGLDPAVYSGLAMGLGLDRLYMLRTGLDDIRLLRSTDPRVTAQLTGLEPYRAVSHHPPISRDVSLALEATLDDELIGDRVRAALGADAALIEELSVLSRTPLEQLPDHAVQRLGIDPDGSDRDSTDNVLLRIVLRALDRNLTAAEANDLRDQVLVALTSGR